MSRAKCKAASCCSKARAVCLRIGWDELAAQVGQIDALLQIDIEAETRPNSIPVFDDETVDEIIRCGELIYSVALEHEDEGRTKEARLSSQLGALFEP